MKGCPERLRSVEWIEFDFNINLKVALMALRQIRGDIQFCR